MWQIINGFICSLITIIGVFLFGKIVLNKEIEFSKEKIIISIIATTIIHTAIYLNLEGTIKTILMILLDICFYDYIFKLSIKKSILTAVLYTIVMIIAELIELFIITKVLKMNISFLYETYASSIISNALICLVFITITYVSKKMLRKIIKAKIETNIKIIIYSFLMLICTLMFFYTFIKELRLSENVIMYLVSMIVLITVLLTLIKQSIDNNKLTREYDKLLEFMTTYEKEVEKQRVLRHETKNEFLTIRGKIHDKQNSKEIISYIDEILKEKIEVKQEEYAKFGYLPANGIKGLCYLKIQEAQDKGISTSINISKRIENSNIYKLDIKEQRNLGKILGVYLDNAIEASLDSKDKRIGIEAYLIKNECQIIISNSYNKNINLNKVGKEKYSTKGKNRGHGLLLVKYITSNNNIFDTTTDITDKLYVQKIAIKKP